MDVIEASGLRGAMRNYPADGRFATTGTLGKTASRASSAMDLQPRTSAIVQGRNVLARFAGDAKTRLLKTTATGTALARYGARLVNPNFHIFQP
jgi:hypothetical protein